MKNIKNYLLILLITIGNACTNSAINTKKSPHITSIEEANTNCKYTWQSDYNNERVTDEGYFYDTCNKFKIGDYFQIIKK